MNSLSTERIPMADWVKAIAIYLVVMSHTAIARPVANWAFMVEIPLFFFMSGYLFRFDRNPSFGGFAKKRFRQIMVPYVTINIVTYLFWLFVARHFGADSTASVPLWQPLLGVLLADSTLMTHNATMYFFTTLFNIEILFYLLFRGRKIAARAFLTLVFVMLGGIDYYLNPAALPFSVSHTLTGIVFYSIGYETRNSRVFSTFMNNRSARAESAKLILAGVLFVVSLLLFSVTGAVNLQRRAYSVYPLYFIETAVAIYSILMLFSIPSVVPRIIRQVSANTLWLCGYHLLVFTLLKGVLVYIMGVDLGKLDGALLPNVLFSLAALLFCLCATIIIRRYRRRNRRTVEQKKKLNL